MLSPIRESPVLTISPASQNPSQLQHQGTYKHMQESSGGLHACLETRVPNRQVRPQETSWMHPPQRSRTCCIYKIT